MTAPLIATRTSSRRHAPTHIGANHPILAGAAVVIVGYVALVALLVAAGLVVTHLLAHSVGSWDEHANSWFARHRTSLDNRVTGDFTDLADTFGIAAVAAVVVIVSLVRRKVRYGVMLLLAIAIELTGFLASSYTVQRPRPAVGRVGSTPSTYSWPSGHVAATLALYAGIAVIVTMVTRRLWPRIVSWIVAGAMVVCVALSRVYRGDHHPTDAVAGLVLGMAALSIAIIALRTWGGGRRDPDVAAEQTGADRSRSVSLA
jgi:undecaprenyl-diphosphatase